MKSTACFYLRLIYMEIACFHLAMFRIIFYMLVHTYKVFLVQNTCIEMCLSGCSDWLQRLSWWAAVQRRSRFALGVREMSSNKINADSSKSSLKGDCLRMFSVSKAVWILWFGGTSHTDIFRGEITFPWTCFCLVAVLKNNLKVWPSHPELGQENILKSGCSQAGRNAFQSILAMLLQIQSTVWGLKDLGWGARISKGAKHHNVVPGPSRVVTLHICTSCCPQLYFV